MPRFTARRLPATPRKLVLHGGRGGFTLLEIVLALFLILAIIVMLLSASGTLVSSRSSNLRSIAAKIGSREIESLRKMDFDSLPPTGSFADADLSKLPQGAATQTLTSYQTSPDIKLVTIQVNWVENSVTKSLSEDTLIYRNGLK
ncbi:MAG: hypothetical protein Q7S45_02245 [Candidatus Curtissbacteria bacterium]|nr:hypothetical protein [Candidatus Curtissbacteria bacterium]